jgi:hypothetical protein
MDRGAGQGGAGVGVDSYNTLCNITQDRIASASGLELEMIALFYYIVVL